MQMETLDVSLFFQAVDLGQQQWLLDLWKVLRHKRLSLTLCGRQRDSAGSVWFLKGSWAPAGLELPLIGS